MARVYHVDIARYAAHADQKWLDNLLSHFSVPGATGRRQGKAREVTTHGIRHIVLVHRLAHDGRFPIADAVSLAAQLLSGDGVSDIAAGLELRLDRPAFDHEVDELIAQAVETVVPAKRGRPPKRRSHDAE
jgi:hypothetical protein